MYYKSEYTLKLALLIEWVPDFIRGESLIWKQNQKFLLITKQNRTEASLSRALPEQVIHEIWFEK